jgi:hypothetical protein
VAKGNRRYQNGKEQANTALIVSHIGGQLKPDVTSEKYHLHIIRYADWMKH